MFGSKKTQMIDRESALPGRSDQTMPVPKAHHVNGNPLAGPWPEGFETAVFGLGCFWGAERKFWETPGVHSTAVGYAGGFTPNPTYEETCSARTGHAEVVLVVFDPSVVSYEALLKVFWENHNPTQGMRQGNDVGSQYRSAIFFHTPEQERLAGEEKARRDASGEYIGPIVTEVETAPPFWRAEEYHQQYFQKKGLDWTCHTGNGKKQKFSPFTR